MIAILTGKRNNILENSLSMEDQIGCFEQLQAFSNTDNIRQISQEPERIEDKVFVRVCASSNGIGIGQLATVLQPLQEKLLLSTATAVGCDGKLSQEEMAEKGTTLKEIISEVLARIDEFRSLEQYIWLVKFSCCLCLLKDLPIGMSFEINKVIRSVAGLDTEEYEFDPLMIHTITKSLFEEIPLDGMNLVHVVKKLTVLNQKLFYYVSIALVFAGIRHYSHPDEPSAMYRLYGFGDVLTELDALKINNIKQTQDLRKLFLILKLLSCYQNAVVLRHSACSWEDIQEQHRCFAECFRFTVDQKKVFTQWLCMARNVVTNLNSKSSMQKIELKEDFLLVIELIDLDMIACFGGRTCRTVVRSSDRTVLVFAVELRGKYLEGMARRTRIPRSDWRSNRLPSNVPVLKRGEAALELRWTKLFVWNEPILDGQRILDMCSGNLWRLSLPFTPHLISRSNPDASAKIEFPMILGVEVEFQLPQAVSGIRE